MLPQAYDEHEETADPWVLLTRGQALLGDLEGAVPGLMSRAASGEGNARALLSALVVLRDFTAKLDGCLLAADIAAERDLKRLGAEVARLRAEVEALRRQRPGRRGRPSGDRPSLNVV